MKIKDVLKYLAKKNIILRCDKQGKLSVKAPRGELTNDIKELIKRNKDSLVAYLKSNDNRLNFDKILPAADADAPLSFAQQRLWFLNEFADKHDTSFNVHSSYRLEGLLDVNSLHQAFNTVIKRHQVLRTFFRKNSNGNPVLCVKEHINITMPIITATHKNVEQLIKNQMATHFDFVEGPLLNILVLRLSKFHHILLLNMHHIVTDGWSIGILIKELTALYQAYRQKKPNPLPALPVQYADYSRWQRQWLSGGILQKQLSYWHKKLHNAASFFPLPADNPRPVRASSAGAEMAFRVDERVTAALLKCCHRYNVTLFMLLFAIFIIQLYRYTGQNDISLGTPIANRNRDEVKDLIGFFVNTLVMRTHPLDDMTFEDLLIHVRQTTMEAYSHQDLPFEQLVELLSTNRSLAYTPLFQIMFVLQNAPAADFKLTDLQVTPMSPVSYTSKFDLTVMLEQSCGGLNGWMEYRTDLFSGESIARMIEHYLHLINNVVNNATEKISRLSLLTEAEVKKLLVDWNSSELTFKNSASIIELFEKQVQYRQNEIAIVDGLHQLSYSQLNSRANQLAGLALLQGLKPQGRVVLYARNPLNMVAGMLAILKSGGCCVLVSAGSPVQKLTHSIFDAGATALLYDDPPATMPGDDNLIAVHFDCGRECDLSAVTANPGKAPALEDTALLIYPESSATPLPPVAISHAGLACATIARVSRYDVCSNHLLLPVATRLNHAFSGIFYTLCSGARLVYAHFSAGHNNELSDLLQRQQITHIFCSASLTPLLNNTALTNNHRLKAIIIAGINRSCLFPLANSVLRTGRVFIETGPGDDTVLAMIYESGTVNGYYSLTARAVHPFNAFVLDHNLNCVPVGVTGQLYVGAPGSDCCSTGNAHYAPGFAKEALTGFDQPALIKTGQLVRRLPDGAINLIGRVNRQVIIRGITIDCDEIESALERFDAIKQAAVTEYKQPASAHNSHKQATDEQRLVAYITTDKITECENTPQDNHLSVNYDQVEKFLKSHLLDYKIPSHFIEVDKLSWLAEGVLDKDSLPDPDKFSGNKKIFMPPDTQTEKWLAKLWAHVLLVPELKISRNDNFFTLNGNSLQAVQLAVRIYEKAGFEPAINALFEFSTLAQMASYIDKKQSEQNVFEKITDDNTLETGML